MRQRTDKRKLLSAVVSFAEKSVPSLKKSSSLSYTASRGPGDVDDHTMTSSPPAVAASLLGDVVVDDEGEELFLLTQLSMLLPSRRENE